MEDLLNIDKVFLQHLSTSEMKDKLKTIYQAGPFIALIQNYVQNKDEMWTDAKGLDGE